MDNKEIKEEVRKEENNLNNDKNSQTIVKVEVVEPKVKKTSIISRIFSFILWIIMLLVLASVILGLVNFGKISNNEEPYAVLDTKLIEKENKNITIYDFGIYRIEKIETAESTTISLKPFFMSENN